MTVCVAVALGNMVAAQPVAVQPRVQIVYPGPHADRKELAAAVPLGNGDPLWVTVVLPGANPAQAAPPPASAAKIEMVAHDPVSRLGFLRVTGQAATASQGAKWLERVASPSGGTLFAMGPAGQVKCHTHGWVQQVGGKILPLALLRVTFDRAAPPPGTALSDGQGRIAAVFFQTSGEGNSGYAIPAEAIHRVRRDISAHGHLVRGWIGLSLQAERQSPQVVRVLPDSPAAKSGVLPDDILTHVDGRAVSSYADAVNAFFYLVPGRPAPIQVTRAGKPMGFTVTPAVPETK